MPTPLISMTQIGGLDVGGNLLSQSVKRSRDNLNLSQDVDGTVITRYPGKELEINGSPLSTYNSGDFVVKKVFPYVGDKDQAAPVVMIQDQNGTYSAQMGLWDQSVSSNLPVFAQTTTPPVISFLGGPAYTDSDFTEIDEVLVFTLQEEAGGQGPWGIQQYDGTKWHRAGLPQPYIPSAISFGTPVITFWRGLYASIDFQGNETYGQFVYAAQLRDSGSGDLRVDPRKAGGFPAAISTATGAGTGADRNRLDLGFDDKYMVASTAPGVQVYDSMAQTVTFSDASVDHNLSPGDWLQFSLGFGTTGYPVYDLINSGSSQIPYLLAMPVISTTATSVVFNADPAVAKLYLDKSYWSLTVDWIWYQSDPLNWTNLFPMILSNSCVSNTWLMSFTSASLSSGYIFADCSQIPFLYASSFYREFAYQSAPSSIYDPMFPFRCPGLGSRMEDIVDDTTVKIPFPDNCGLLSTFDNLALAASDQAVFWSDTSMGGSSFMTTGLDNAVPGSSKDGPIVGLSAADEFVFVSRKYRNYSIIGTLPTFNFQINPYAYALPGTNYFGNVITVGGSVYFGNSLGIWEVYGTNIKNLSQAIAGAFYRESDPHYVAGTSTPLRFLALEGSYDSLKGRCIWKVENPADGAVLDWAVMLDTKTGEWFRWDGMGVNTLQLINGLWYTADDTNEVFVEDTARAVDVASYWVTTWQTVNNPSFEKQYTQIKVFCRSAGNADLDITTYEDWSENPIDNGPLDVLAMYELSQKKKVTSNKSLAFSIKVEAAEDQVMQIQGVEVELNPIQEGMKR